MNKKYKVIILGAGGEWKSLQKELLLKEALESHNIVVEMCTQDSLKTGLDVSSIIIDSFPEYLVNMEEDLKKSDVKIESFADTGIVEPKKPKYVNGIKIPHWQRK